MAFDLLTGYCNFTLSQYPADLLAVESREELDLIPAYGRHFANV
jgi:hypothetical protein